MMRTKYRFIITLAILSFSGLLMAQFNPLSKEGREAAKREAEEIKLLDAKRAALLKKNNYPMPVNVSKNFKKKSELVGIVKEEEEEVKVSLKGFAKAMYVDPLKKMPDAIRGKNMVADGNGYIPPETYFVDRYNITGPILTEFKGGLIAIDYWSRKAHAAPKEKLKNVKSVSSSEELNNGTAYRELADGTVGERSIQESRNESGVRKTLKDQLHRIGNPIVEYILQDFSYEVNIKNKLQTECKCESKFYLDNKEGQVKFPINTKDHSSWWRMVAIAESLGYNSELNCSFTVDKVLYEFTINDDQRYPYFDGQIKKSSKKSNASFTIRQTLDTQWGKEDLYYPPSRTFIVTDEENTEFLVTTSGLEVIPPEEPVGKLSLKSGFKMLKEQTVEMSKTAAMGGDLENMDLSFMEKKNIHKALHLSKKIDKKDKMAFNLIGTVLSNFDLINYSFAVSENNRNIPKYDPYAPALIDDPDAAKTPDDGGLRVSFDRQIDNPDYIYWKKHLENK
jgi:hypothetical protein